MRENKTGCQLRLANDEFIYSPLSGSKLVFGRNCAHVETLANASHILKGLWLAVEITGGSPGKARRGAFAPAVEMAVKVFGALGLEVVAVDERGDLALFFRLRKELSVEEGSVNAGFRVHSDTVLSEKAAVAAGKIAGFALRSTGVKYDAGAEFEGMVAAMYAGAKNKADEFVQAPSVAPGEEGVDIAMPVVPPVAMEDSSRFFEGIPDFQAVSEEAQ
ncbi:MAG: hypothetical protein WC657_00675 [Candidatus Paceibacterota bacterium]|jgi:hypothetical protein